MSHGQRIRLAEQLRVLGDRSERFSDGPLREREAFVLAEHAGRLLRAAIKSGLIDAPGRVRREMDAEPARRSILAFAS